MSNSVFRKNNTSMCAKSEYEQYLLLSCIDLDLHANKFSIYQNLVIIIDTS